MPSLTREAILDLGSRAASPCEHFFLSGAKGFAVISSPGEKFPGQPFPRCKLGWRPSFFNVEILSQKRSSSPSICQRGISCVVELQPPPCAARTIPETSEEWETTDIL